MVRVNYAPPRAPIIPFVASEVLLDLSSSGAHQNRLMHGFGIPLRKGIRLDLGGMLRSRRDATGWTHDSVAFTYLFAEWDAE